MARPVAKSTYRTAEARLGEDADLYPADLADELVEALYLADDVIARLSGTRSTQAPTAGPARVAGRNAAGHALERLWKALAKTQTAEGRGLCCTGPHWLESDGRVQLTPLSFVGVNTGRIGSYLALLGVQ